MKRIAVITDFILTTGIQLETEAIHVFNPRPAEMAACNSGNHIETEKKIPNQHNM
jgi:hypothetical protein